MPPGRRLSPQKQAPARSRKAAPAAEAPRGLPVGEDGQEQQGAEGQHGARHVHFREKEGVQGEEGQQKEGPPALFQQVEPAQGGAGGQHRAGLPRIAQGAQVSAGVAQPRVRPAQAGGIEAQSVDARQLEEAEKALEPQSGGEGAEEAPPGEGTQAQHQKAAGIEGQVQEAFAAAAAQEGLPLPGGAEGA